MSIFSSIEGRIDRALARLFGRREDAGIQPVTIAREAARAMESRRQVGVDAVYVPNHFEVHLHPGDLARIQPVQHTARRDAVRYVVRTAERKGFAFAGPVEVELVADAALERGSLSVRATFREEVPSFDKHVQTARYGGPLRFDPESALASNPDLEEATRLFALGQDPTGQEANGWLEVHGEDGNVQRFPLVPGRAYTIGRSEESDLRLTDARVSRRHARLVHEDGAWWIEDLQTTNGTRKNGAFIRRERLQHGDELSMGRVVMRYTEMPSRR